MRRIAYNPSLDGLRALAVAAVVAEHAGYRLMGHDGVTVFFVISGYLITTLLLRERDGTGRIDVRAFYRRRWARLMPALGVVLAVTAAWVLALGLPVRGWLLGLVGGGTYTTDLIEAAGGKPGVSSYFEYTWSLGVEEQFYLVWPLLLLALIAVAGRLGRRSLGICCAALAIASVAQRLSLAHAGASGTRINFALDTNVAPIAIGALLAVMTAGDVSLRVRRAVAAIGAAALATLALIVLLPTIAPHWHVGDRRYWLVPVIAGLVVAGAALVPGRGLGRLIGSRPLAHIGRLSYGLYLWNMLLMNAFHEISGVKPAHAGWDGVIWLAVLLGICEASYRWVELPLRGRMANRRPSEPVVPAPEPVAV